MTADGDVHGSAQAARVMAALRDRIRAAGGWLPFDEYMRFALYAPGLGYYSAGAAKLGAAGDFITAPELSPLFGTCLARHCAQVLAATGGGDLLELGAGSGRLAHDLLTGLQAMDAPPARYRILEVSADLRARQQALLGALPVALASRVEWLDAPPADDWRGALVANEVLDALPVQCFSWRDAAFERGVALDAAGLPAWSERPAAPALASEVRRLQQDAGAAWPSGYRSELCMQAQPWIDAVTQRMTQGVALFVDYGLARRDYYHPHRHAGTLRCHYRHQAHDDPFAHPGLEDITAWVDFTRVAEAADAADLEVLGYATQSGALLGLGIEQHITAIADGPLRARRASEARQLLMPEEMGETFKFIALGRGFGGELSAFAHQDLRRLL